MYVLLDISLIYRVRMVIIVVNGHIYPDIVIGTQNYTTGFDQTGYIPAIQLLDAGPGCGDGIIPCAVHSCGAVLPGRFTGR